MVCYASGYVERQHVKRGTGCPGTAANTETNIHTSMAQRNGWHVDAFARGAGAYFGLSPHCPASIVDCHGVTEAILVDRRRLIEFLGSQSLIESRSRVNTLLSSLWMNRHLKVSASRQLLVNIIPRL